MRLTRPLFADRLGVGVSTITRYENNGDRPSAAMLARLSTLAGEQGMIDVAEALDLAQVRRNAMYLRDLAEHCYHLPGQVDSYFIEYTRASSDADRQYAAQRLFEMTKAIREHIGNPVLNPFFIARTEDTAKVEE
jgi:transcriptional regulator with XRE-family HTH domain